MHVDDLFVLDYYSLEVLEGPSVCKNYTLSQCTPLFMCCYEFGEAQSVIHSHSKNALMATIVFSDDEFQCSHLEMIKVCLINNLPICHFLTV